MRKGCSCSHEITLQSAAACLCGPPLTQRLPSPAACSRLPGAAPPRAPLPSARDTRGCGEAVSPTSQRVDFLPAFSLLPVPAPRPLPPRTSLHCLAGNGWRFSCHSNWLSTEGSRNPEMSFDGWATALPFPLNVHYFTTRNSFWIKHFSTRESYCTMQTVPRKCEFLYQMNLRKDRQTSSTKGCWQLRRGLPWRCTTALLRGTCWGWGGSWPWPQQRLGPVALPTLGHVFQISWSKRWGGGIVTKHLTSLPTVELQRNEEIPFATESLRNSIICWCCRTNAPLWFVLYFAFYFAIVYF